MGYDYYVSFDVESVGLHGTGFAVGYVVLDKNGNEVESGCFCCPLTSAVKETDSKADI